MGDSDDEYERRRARDKFRRERSDYQDRGERGGGRGDERGRRDDYVDGRRELWTRDRVRRDYAREVDMRRRERFSPPRHDMSPPMKKMRRDWDDRGYGNYDSGYGGSVMGGHQGSWGNMGHEMSGGMHSQHISGGGGYGGPAGTGAHANHRDIDMCPTQPPMMTFKQFLASQDDSINDDEAVRKYNDYKLDFRRQQLNEFFLAHKDEEWFKSKYQPEEFAKRKNDQLSALNRRVEVYLSLMDNPRFADLTVDCEKSDELLKLLDAVVIKLEGGNDTDLKVLDEPFGDDGIFKVTKPILNPANIEIPKKKDSERKESWDNWESLDGQEANTERKESSAKAEKAKSETEEEGQERKSEDNEENWSVSGKGDDEDSGRPDSAASSSNTADVKGAEDKIVPEKVLNAEVKSEKEPEDISVKDEVVEDQGDGEREDEDKKSEQILAPRPLHRTCSIFLRNLAPTITKQEVEAMCRRFSGFLRVAIADPQPERRFFRRGWVTFERGVNIKEICWNLNNIRLRDCELGAIVNRDLTRRIRPCNGITAHRQIARADIKLAAKIIQNLDKRHGLWTEDVRKEVGEKASFGLISRNPLLKNITDYLIEEADAEEEELLGKSASEDTKKEGETGNEMTVERDEALLKMLDRLLLYLRIVHSVDYYNHSDYPNEDEMPNRCGIMHGRGIAPSVKVTQAEISDYITAFEQKMAVFLLPLAKLSDEEATKLGKKDPNIEVEKFIVANTQELGKDKWLCPLSGKKFKGPEYVKKHIFNKHGEKVDEVRKEVEYFNNYLMDPKRPQLPEHPINRPHRGGPGPGGVGPEGAREGYSGPSFGGGQGYPHPPHYPYGYGPGARMPGPFSSGFGNRGHYQSDSYNSGGPPAGGPVAGGGFYGAKRGAIGRNRGDTREIIGYHDLDAPDDVDVF